MAFRNGMRPVHPGEVLKEDFLAPLGMSVNALAKALGVPAPRINDVARERRGVSPDTAMRLARYFGADLPPPEPVARISGPMSTIAGLPRPMVL